MRSAFILAGEPGSGKTVMAASYVPKGMTTTPKRLVIDMEARAPRYRSAEYGTVGDDPKKLLFEFDLWPTSQITMESFLVLYKGIRDGSIKPDVLITDNISLLQDEMVGWCQSASDASVLAQEAGIEKKFALFLKTNFRVGEPNHWKLMKSIFKAFLLDLRKAEIDFVGTTELHNVWQSYGKKGRDANGEPFQKILGQSASMWDCFEQVTDTVWNLTRVGADGKVLTGPVVTIDRFIPKCSIVGVPPKFAYTNWARIWQWESERKVPDDKKMAELPVVSPQYSSTETVEGDEEPLVAGQKKLVAELMAAGYTNSTEMFAAMKTRKLVYTLDQHNAIAAILIKTKSVKAED